MDIVQVAFPEDLVNYPSHFVRGDRALVIDDTAKNAPFAFPRLYAGGSGDTKLPSQSATVPLFGIDGYIVVGTGNRAPYICWESFTCMLHEHVP